MSRTIDANLDCMFLCNVGPSTNAFQGIQINDLFLAATETATASLSAHLDNGSRLTPRKLATDDVGKNPWKPDLANMMGSLCRVCLLCNVKTSGGAGTQILGGPERDTLT